MLASVPELKLFCHLGEKMIGREIRTFSGLVDYVRGLSPSFDPAPTLLACFQLLKEMSWGFLRELSRSEYPKLWKELVLPHPDFPAAGDLKRNISISNIYICMLDIHGYTRFCQESKANLSRLRKLDEFLHEGIRNIARSNSCLANRERGDEIVVVAAGASDLIKTTLQIINAFSKHAVVKDQEVGGKRGDYSIILPEFKVTAGAAGGNLTTPLIITESGLLSGFLLNTAARLQNLASELSPRDSKIMVTNAVYSSYLKENKIVQSDLYAKNLIQFFTIGPVSFKGTKVSCYEILYADAERFRMGYMEHLERLFESIRQELWKGKVLEDLLEVIIQVCAKSPPFGAAAGPAKAPAQPPSNSSIIRLCQKARQLYHQDEFLAAVDLLGEIRRLVEQSPDFDRLAARYLAEIHGKYRLVAEEYAHRLEQEIEQKVDVIFPPRYRQAYLSSKKYFQTYEKLKSFAQRSRQIASRKVTWNALMEEMKEALKLDLYVGKR
jgi:hypothetical protein